MRPLQCAAFAGALLLVAAPALSFQETTVGGGDKGGQALGAPAQAPAAADKGINLSIPDIAAPKSSGTEVRIPGIGTVGVLPKLDFGLELLYGAAEQKGMTAPDDRTAPDAGDLQIRGTIKHRF